MLKHAPFTWPFITGRLTASCVVLILVGLAGQTRADSPDTTTPPRSTPMNDIPFADYLRRFDYDERVAMKIQLPELLKLYAENQVQLIDIRFNEEYAAWRLGIGQHIPLNELPDRLDELDPNKTIVTMCPHYDRAEIARLFLTLKGYKSRYLTDGMLGLVDHLRGDRARDYMERIASDTNTD